MKTYVVTITRDFLDTVEEVTIQAKDSTDAYIKVYERNSDMAILNVKEQEQENER